MKFRPPRPPTFDEASQQTSGLAAPAAPSPTASRGGESGVSRAPATGSTVLADTRPARAVVEAVSPVVDGGRFAAKTAIDSPTTVSANVFTDGHDVVFAQLDVHRPHAATKQSDRTATSSASSPVPAASFSLPMEALGNDRYAATFTPDELGTWTYDVVGWVSHAETWRRGTVLKSEAGVDTAVEAQIGARLVTAMLDNLHDVDVHLDGFHDVDDLDEQGDLTGDLQVLERLLTRLDDGDVSSLDDDDLTDVFFRVERRDPVDRFAAPLRIDVDPKLATVGAWYSFFPRSTVGRPDDAPRPPATLRDAIGRLDYVAALGFDVVYIPPVHPIGSTNRKGRNNVTVAETDDVGSPYAIGSDDGGHRSVAPELGTVDDVADLADGCRERGMELALDIAFNCSPDHPWVREHPEWFTERPDGTIQYAENPPKKYEDIYPLDFESSDWQGLWHELAEVFRFWIDVGVRIFRVDNPHTKAFAFWEWAIGSIHRDHPDVIFLSEAFTRPRVMQRLAKLGFNQSYTYFAWRHSAAELQEYFEELSTETIDFLRPNVWPNTHDILTEQLQTGGRAGFVSRAILAATLSPSWGIYGPVFELMEIAPRPGVEDYLDSEKYEVRHWDLDRADSLAPLIARLNEIRREHLALVDLASIRFHGADHAGLLCFSKVDPTGAGEPVIVVASVDPHAVASGFVDIDLAAIGLAYGSDYDVIDRLGGVTYRWSGNRNFVELSPHGAMAHIFTVHPVPDATAEHGTDQDTAEHTTASEAN